MSSPKLRLFLIFLLCLTRISLAQDFPNYFQELVPNPAHSLNPNTEVAEQAVEETLKSILENIELPHIWPYKQPQPSAQIATKGFFNHLKEHAKELDPDAQVFVSGGVVRSLLSFIYSSVYHAKQKDRNKPVQLILKEIQENAKKGISSLKALGIGSDLDILVIPSEKSKKNIMPELHSFIEAAKLRSPPGSTTAAIEEAFSPSADVKDYLAQINETTKQGGSALDWLAFPLSGTKMKTPEGRGNDAFHKFILGEFDYFAPSNSDPKDVPKGVKDKQTIRGLRALVEMPFLQVSANTQAQLISELENLIHVISQGGYLSEDALKQFVKMLRNGRFANGRNRFHLSQGEIERLVLKLVNLYKDQKKQILIPEYVGNKKIRERNPAEDKCGLKPYLISETKFLDNYTDGGILHHGTKEIQNILYIMRNGFFVSSYEQGNAEKGRGLYTTNDPSTAAKFGISIDLKVKKNPYIRVINWDQVRDQPQVTELLKAYDLRNRTGLDQAFKFLAEQCDIDVIIHEHVLIQNSNVVKRPKHLSELIYSYEKQTEAKIDAALKNPNRNEIQEANQYLDRYITYLEIGASLGVEGISIARFEKLYSKIENHPQTEVRQGFISSLASRSGKEFTRLLEKASADRDPTVRASVLFWINQNAIGDRFHFIRKGMEDSDTKVRSAAVEGLSYSTNAEHIQLLKKALQDQQPTVRAVVVAKLAASPMEDALLLIRGALNDSSSEVRSAAVTAYLTREIDSTEPLERILADSDRSIRSLAAFQIISQNQQKRIHWMLRHSNPEIKRLLLEKISSIKDPVYWEALDTALTDSDPKIHQLAIDSISSHSTEEGFDHLDKLSKHPDPEIRLAVFRNSNFWQRVGTQPMLQRMLTDPDSKIRETGIQKIFSSHLPQDISDKLFEKALLDSDPAVKNQVLKLLNQYLEDAELPKLVGLFKLPDQDIRTKTAQLLKKYSRFYGGKDKNEMLQSYVSTGCSVPIQNFLPQKDLQQLMDYLKQETK